MPERRSLEAQRTATITRESRDEGANGCADEPSECVEEHIVRGGGPIDRQHPLGDLDQRRDTEREGRCPRDDMHPGPPQQSSEETDRHVQQDVGYRIFQSSRDIGLKIDGRALASPFGPGWSVSRRPRRAPHEPYCQDPVGGSCAIRTLSD